MLNTRHLMTVNYPIFARGLKANPPLPGGMHPRRPRGPTPACRGERERTSRTLSAAPPPAAILPPSTAPARLARSPVLPRPRLRAGGADRPSSSAEARKSTPMRERSRYDEEMEVGAAAVVMVTCLRRGIGACRERREASRPPCLTTGYDHGQPCRRLSRYCGCSGLRRSR